MNKEKILIWGLVLLFILNIVLLFTLWRQSPAMDRPPHHKEGSRKIIIERLNFNREQIEEYDNLIAKHRNSIRQEERKMAELRSRLYQQIGTDTQEKDELLEEIGELQEQIEKIHYHHFEDIRQLCHEDQLDDFRDLSQELNHLFRPKHPPHQRRKNFSPPPKD